MVPRTVLLLLASAACGAATRLPAQTAPRGGATAATRRAAESIVEADLRSGIGVISDDSMRGRNTPSPELEKVAAWIAGRFQSFGLTPGGDSGTYLQRYTIRRLRVDPSSFVMAMGRGAHGHWMLGRESAIIFGQPPADPLTAPIVLLAGIPADTARPFGTVAMRGTIVLHVLHAGQIGNQLVALISQGVAAGVKAWIFVSDRRAGEFALFARASLQPQLEVAGQNGGPLPISSYEVRDSSALEVLRAAGEDPAALLAAGVPAATRPLEGFTATISVRRTVVSEASAPNVVGVLEGSDPQLTNEYVLFSGHMDHLGVGRPVGGDSIYNGADDDASGTIGVVELAQAYSRLNPRPKRTLVFMTVSGEEEGLWGSAYYASHPTFPLASTVADLNLDMIGRNWRDTVVAIGKEHSSLGPLADSVAAHHPELDMTVINDIWPQERLLFRSDHYNFARKGVPILFFTSGLHPDYHRPSDSVEKIDAEKEARIVRLVFYLGLDVANTPARPAWNPESRRQIVEAASP